MDVYYSCCTYTQDDLSIPLYPLIEKMIIIYSILAFRYHWNSF